MLVLALVSALESVFLQDMQRRGAGSELAKATNPTKTTRIVVRILSFEREICTEVR